MYVLRDGITTWNCNELPSTRDRGSTRSVLARRRGGDRFESRLDTAS